MPKIAAFDRAEGTLFNSQGQAALRRAAPGKACRVMGPLKEGDWFGRVVTNGALSGPGFSGRNVPAAARRGAACSQLMNEVPTALGRAANHAIGLLTWQKPGATFHACREIATRGSITSR